MIEWILFVCGVAVGTQQVSCVAAVAPTEIVCKFERDEINARSEIAGAICVPREKPEDEQG